jgi:hypothetical protein
VRVAQAWFWDGYYVRRGVDLQHRFSRDALTVTDLDVLGHIFTPALTSQKHIGEVKSGKSNSTPRPLDRALWARGLRELVQADHAEVTTAFRATADVRGLARTFGVTIQHMDDLDSREHRLLMHEVVDTGSQGTTIALLLKRLRAELKKNGELERAYWFLRSEVWFLDPFDAIKRNIGLMRLLKSRWSDALEHDSLEALRWLYAESISIFGLQLALTAGTARSMDSSSFIEHANAKLSIGDVPLAAMAALSDRFDGYVGRLLKKLGVAPEIQVEAMGAFQPTPPDYTEPLIELIQRLAMQTGATARLPRQLDLLIFERLVRERPITATSSGRLGYGASTERLVKLVSAFLRGQVGLPSTVETALTSPLFSQTDGQLGGADSQQALFDDSDDPAEHQGDQ